MQPPPVWDLTSFFPQFDGPEHREFLARLESDVADMLVAADALPPLEPPSLAAWETLILVYEQVLARVGHINSYVQCLVSAESENESFQTAEARLTTLAASTEKITDALTRGLGRASDGTFAALVARPALEGAHFVLERARINAKFRMDAALESLASDLGPDGFAGWGRLYSGLAGKLSFPMTFPDGHTETVPMAQRRSLMADPDRRVREAAFGAGNAAWAQVGDVVSSALNHIAGTRHVLNARRGVAHVHDVALRDAAISRKTLDAMMEAVRGGAAVARRGLALKSRAMGLAAAAWYDLEAPLPVSNTRRVSWDEGSGMVRSAFAASYPALRAFFDDELARRHVEAEPRNGKRPGAYCTGSDVTDESRVFMTFQGSFGDVSTLAHEIGHAFHAHVMIGQRTLARQYPMTLAETASTFAENLLSDGLISDPATSLDERTLLLGEIAGDASSFLLDIPTRFVFETRLYEERLAGEVPTSRMCELMREAQREIFGDALAVGSEDPWFWASKLHFFITDVSFYNFPYTFGFLVSRALFGEFKKQGPAFLPRYEEFLRNSGRGMAHDVAKATLGKDLEQPDFWAEAIDTLREPLDRLESALALTAPRL